MIRSSYLG